MVFPTFLDNYHENQKSKKNHLRGIQIPFEWAIARPLTPRGHRENRVQKSRKEKQKNKQTNKQTKKHTDKKKNRHAPFNYIDIW